VNNQEILDKAPEGANQYFPCKNKYSEKMSGRAMADIKRIAELEEEVQELTNQLIAMHKGELHD
jgi:hypothetical protein